MRLITAKSAGFCFGVERAVAMAARALDGDGDCWIVGELIHNREVADSLARRGLKTAARVSDIPPGARILIRSHGVGEAEYEAAGERGERLDATCPRVSRIHGIVRRAAAEGRTVVILGMPEHPEVLAIRGWCADSVVLSDAEQTAKWLSENVHMTQKPLTVVFQTTSERQKLEQSVNLLKKQCTNCEIFDTICDATLKRQTEASALSRVCDGMIVIGGRHSANSLHLAGICSANCANTAFVETAGELDVSRFRNCQVIGVTAGASAPAWIIKEVKQKMSDEYQIEEVQAEEVPAETNPVEEVKEQEVPAVEAAAESAEPAAAAEPAEKTFDQLLEDSIKTIYNGDTVTGVVAAITPTEISLDLSTKHSGYIPVSEFTDDGTDINSIIKVGDVIEACVVRVNDVEGTVQLSKRRLDAVKSWNDIEAAREDGTVIEGKVTEENKGGVVVSIKGIRVFVPASQTGLPREAAMTELVGQTVRLKITEVNRGRKRVVGSIRAVQYRERKERQEQIWSTIDVGNVYEGVVKSLTSFGAFVDIGGVDGMVHVSEISWKRIRQPSDVLSVGDEVEVYVLGFDKEKHKISLGYRKAEDNPWARFTTAYGVGDVVNVTVVKLMPFGAFAEVLPGVDGLIHISQIANRRIAKPDEVLTVGDKVDAKITNIDNDNQKISLSIRALAEPEPAPAREERSGGRGRDRDRGPREDALVYSISETGEAIGDASSADYDEPLE